MQSTDEINDQNRTANGILTEPISCSSIRARRKFSSLKMIAFISDGQKLRIVQASFINKLGLSSFLQFKTNYSKTDTTSLDKLMLSRNSSFEQQFPLASHTCKRILNCNIVHNKTVPSRSKILKVYKLSHESCLKHKRALLKAMMRSIFPLIFQPILPLPISTPSLFFLFHDFL